MKKPIARTSISGLEKNQSSFDARAKSPVTPQRTRRNDCTCDKAGRILRSHTKSALILPSESEGSSDLGLKNLISDRIYKWTSVFCTCGLAFLLYFVNFFCTFISLRLTKRRCVFFLSHLMFSVGFGQRIAPFRKKQKTGKFF